MTREVLLVTGWRAFTSSLLMSVFIAIGGSNITAQTSRTGLSAAQLAKLHAINIPIVVPVPPPAGFRVARVTPDAYDKSYKIVYQNTSGATIVFEGTQLYSAPASAAPVAGASPVAAIAEPKKNNSIFGFLAKSMHPVQPATPAAGNPNSGLASETEGQAAMSGIVSDSVLVGPIHFQPAGACLQGKSEVSQAQLRGMRVTVTGCNFDDPDPLVAAYKRLTRV